MFYMTSSPASSNFFSDEELRRNVPNGPDMFDPHGLYPDVIRKHTEITERLVDMKRDFSLRPHHNVTWAYGRTADGVVIGERWAKRGKLGRVVVDVRYFSSESELKAYTCWCLSEHWYEPVQSVIPPTGYSFTH